MLVGVAMPSLLSCRRFRRSRRTRPRARAVMLSRSPRTRPRGFHRAITVTIPTSDHGRPARSLARWLAMLLDCCWLLQQMRFEWGVEWGFEWWSTATRWVYYHPRGLLTHPSNNQQPPTPAGSTNYHPRGLPSARSTATSQQQPATIYIRGVYCLWSRSSLFYRYSTALLPLVYNPLV